MKTVAIFGGSQEQTYKKIGQQYGIEVLFHNGKVRNGKHTKEFRTMIKKCDCVVVLLDACGHVAMDIVKEYAKRMNKDIIFQKGFGASGAIKMAATKLNVPQAS
jgi:hypothetical protein